MGVVGTWGAVLGVSNEQKPDTNRKLRQSAACRAIRLPPGRLVGGGGGRGRGALGVWDVWRWMRWSCQ